MVGDFLFLFEFKHISEPAKMPPWGLLPISFKYAGKYGVFSAFITLKNISFKGREGGDMEGGMVVAGG